MIQIYIFFSFMWQRQLEAKHLFRRDQTCIQFNQHECNSILVHAGNKTGIRHIPGLEEGWIHTEFLNRSCEFWQGAVGREDCPHITSFNVFVFIFKLGLPSKTWPYCLTWSIYSSVQWELTRAWQRVGGWPTYGPTIQINSFILKNWE